MEIEEYHRRSGQRKRIETTFPDGTRFCFRNATSTFVETLKKIGPELASKANLFIGKYPLISQECFDIYKKYMVPWGNGWWVNTQSDTAQKYLELSCIKNQLGIDFNITLADEFDSYTEPLSRAKHTNDNFFVKFSGTEDEAISGKTSGLTFIKAIEYMGAERISAKGIIACNREVVTHFQKYSKQIKIGDRLWISIPASLKDKMNAVRSIASRLGIEVKVYSVTQSFEHIGQICNAKDPELKKELLKKWLNSISFDCNKINWDEIDLSNK